MSDETPSKTDSIMNTALTSATSRISSSCNTWNLSSTNLTVTLWKTNPRLTTCMKHPSCGNAAPPGFAGRAGLSWKASSQTDHRMSDDNDIQNWFNHEHGLDFSHLKNFLILQYLKSKFNQLNSDSLKNKSKADYIYETSVLRQCCTSRVCWKSWAILESKQSDRSSHVWWKWHPKLIQSWTRPWLQLLQEFPHLAILEI